MKYLHHAAERYDIGVYFEANGHGTVIFSPEALAQIASASPSTPNQQNALANLSALTELINQTVGDALSDLLLVETILLHRGYGPKEWDAAYTDLPNRLVKVLVADRGAFATQDAERTLVAPAGLQAKIDATVAKYKKGRSFVRPSGTEDCVRVYAEAATRAEADGESERARSPDGKDRAYVGVSYRRACLQGVWSRLRPGRPRSAPSRVCLGLFRRDGLLSAQQVAQNSHA